MLVLQLLISIAVFIKLLTLRDDSRRGHGIPVSEDAAAALARVRGRVEGNDGREFHKGVDTRHLAHGIGRVGNVYGTQGLKKNDN